VKQNNVVFKEAPKQCDSSPDGEGGTLISALAKNTIRQGRPVAARARTRKDQTTLFSVVNRTFSGTGGQKRRGDQGEGASGGESPVPSPALDRVSQENRGFNKRPARGPPKTLDDVVAGGNVDSDVSEEDVDDALITPPRQPAKRPFSETRRQKVDSRFGVGGASVLGSGPTKQASLFNWVSRRSTSSYASPRSHGASPNVARTPDTGGMRNLGNTCYMNAVLQCLVSLRPLVGALRPDTPLAKSFLDLASRAVLDTSTIKRTLGRFPGHDQEDAHEFMTSLLSSIDDEQSLKDVFEWRVERIITCDECGHTSNIVESFFDFAVDFAEGENTLDGLLRRYFAPDVVERRCDEKGCSGLAARVTEKMRQAPAVMVVQVKRFFFDHSGSVQKLDDFLLPATTVHLGKIVTCEQVNQTPLHGSYDRTAPSDAPIDPSMMPQEKQEQFALNLSRLGVGDGADERRKREDLRRMQAERKASQSPELVAALDRARARLPTTVVEGHEEVAYRLVATTFHHGVTARSGHYTAGVYKGARTRWNMYNDENVTEVSALSAFLNRRRVAEGYLYFLVREDAFASHQQLVNLV